MSGYSLDVPAVRTSDSNDDRTVSHNIAPRLNRDARFAGKLENMSTTTKPIIWKPLLTTK